MKYTELSLVFLVSLFVISALRKIVNHRDRKENAEDPKIL